MIESLSEILLRLSVWRKYTIAQKDPEVTFTFENEQDCYRACTRLAWELRSLMGDSTRAIPHVAPDISIQFLGFSVTFTWRKPPMPRNAFSSRLLPGWRGDARS